MKKLNLALSSVEIDQIMDFVRIEADGMVEWKSFVNRL
jgi:hypothetical protein